jgi:hypothetical protein
MQRERISKQKLLASLPPSGAPGSTRYTAPHTASSIDVPWLDMETRDQLNTAAEESPTGSVLFATDDAVTLVLPPFAIEQSHAASEIDTASLTELLERPRAYAAFLLRRGGYTTGFFRGDFLVASKTGSRFVKNRHRAGGQSQGRYDRIRDKQIHELLEKACEDARATLTPYEQEIEHVFLGGDRLLLIEFRKQCNYFDHFGDKIAQRTLPLTGDPRRATLDTISREVWSSTVYTVGRQSS